MTLANHSQGLAHGDGTKLKIFIKKLFNFPCRDTNQRIYTICKRSNRFQIWNMELLLCMRQHQVRMRVYKMLESDIHGACNELQRVSLHSRCPSLTEHWTYHPPSPSYSSLVSMFFCLFCMLKHFHNKHMAVCTSQTNSTKWCILLFFFRRYKIMEQAE